MERLFKQKRHFPVIKKSEIKHIEFRWYKNVFEENRTINLFKLFE